MTTPSTSRTSNARWLPLLAIALMVSLSGCKTVKGWFEGKDADQKRLSKPVELAEFSPSTRVTRLWSTKAGDGDERLGLVQSPAIADGRVYAAAGDEGVRALDLQTGASVWRYTGKDLRISGGPGVGDGLVVVGTLDGQVIALDATTGTEKWAAKVPSETVAAPAIGQGMVFVRSNDGRITAFDAANGERRWFWNHELPSLTVRGNDAPVLGPGFVFVGNDDGSLVALSLSDGRPLWDQTVGQPDGRTELDRMADVDGTPALDGTTLFASSYKKQTVAIDAPTGRPLWSQENGGAGRVGVGIDRVVVSDPAGIVWGLDKIGGSSMWQQAGLTRRNPGGAAIQGDFAVVGDVEGYLHWLRLDNGDFAARARPSRSPIRSAPVVADGVLVVQDVKGEISAWRLAQ